MHRPDYLAQGEAARLFPVLANTSKEGRTTSIVLACLSSVREFGAELLGSVGQRLGARATVDTYTEIVFTGEKGVGKDRPDGLIVLRNGKKEWKALVEAKVGTSQLQSDQIERYRQVARDHNIDCVITISNQFATAPANHPLPDVRKSRSRVPVFHWSWMSILTIADLLMNREDIADTDQSYLMNELRRFLTHESAGVRGFERMPPEWTDLNRHVSAGGKILARSSEAAAVLEAWHQETRDLSLILSRQAETVVHQMLPRKLAADPAERHRQELQRLRDSNQLYVELDIPDAAAPLEVVADIPRRTIDVGMSLRAPQDKKSSKARVNWLLRQIKTERTSELFVRMNWPGRSPETQFHFDDLKADPGICEEGKHGLQVVGFHVYFARRLGARFTQQSNFISELEAVVPEFYREVGQELAQWHKPAPRIKPEKSDPDDVDVESIEADADELSRSSD
ncbi:hypothetical protein [Sinisalibacter aestuarii]|uniref:Stress response protein n=1 Tax=Sinisalibacter aestuarii TaxID=2949426 RepID=A0ABQ5LPG0_9RHOB|nr:hypothetical protein [Sinisalibacter aestuarii]GKY86900.1 hypothetical protein STA1M1_07690 [Sinisalibacter aestuarii]